MKFRNFVLILVLLFSVNLFGNTKFDLKDANGKSIKIIGTDVGLTFPASKGKVVLLNFFGKRCPPCLMEIPHLISVKNRFKEGFELIAVQVQEPLGKDLNNFISEKKINYTVIDGIQTIPFSQYIMRKTGWQSAIPFMLLFDKEGRFVKSYLGMVSEEEINQDIQALLK